MRGAGVGDGLGDGTGVGEGVWASASSGDFEAANPAAPSAGSSFTKSRLLVRVFEDLFFFIVLKKPVNPDKSCQSCEADFLAKTAKAIFT